MVFHYVALGDSLTVGVGSSLFSQGFVLKFQQLAAEKLGTQIFVQVFAHSGFLSKDILQALEDEFIQEQLKEASIITITAGGNDLIQAARKYEEDHLESDFNSALNNCMENYRKIIMGLRQLKESKPQLFPFIVRPINLYNPFPQNDLAEKWIKRFNMQLNHLSKAPCISVAKIDRIFKGHEKEYLSADRIHPNDFGYRKISESLDLLGYGQLQADIEGE